MNNDNYFEAMRGLWLEHGGEPDKELHPEDYGRYVAARMAEARRPDSRLSDFDAWARRERREQAKADDLHGVRGALERIADAVEAQRLNHVASLTVGELMAALQPLMDGEADAGDDYAELDVETHEDTDAGRTDHYTLLLEDGMRATVTTWHDDGGTGAYVMAPVDDLFAPNPQALHDLASRFRAYAKAFDNLAELWDADRRTGVIPTVESVR